MSATPSLSKDATVAADVGATEDAPLLEAVDLVKHFPRRSGLLRKSTSVTRAVDGVSFTLHRGETLGLVGESGCGKSTTGKTLMGLTPATGGQVRLDGEEISGEAGLHKLRNNVQIVFQDPYASLSPRMTVRDIVAEPLRIQHRYRTKEDGMTGQQRVEAALQAVGLSMEQANRYAHEFSGGQRQRIGIARALVLQPRVIVLDEPVSALDVSIRAQVINQLENVQNERGLAYLFISHDLSVVRHTCDRIAVMYLGKIVEIGDKDEIFTAPAHPYTQALLSAIPSPEIEQLGQRERIVLRGDVPSPSNPPSGCRFRTRCWKAQEICATTEPLLEPAPGSAAAAVVAGVADEAVDPAAGHRVACHFPEAIDVLGGEPVRAYATAE
ncbi:ABC transporter ATP-binding protein [Nakamurella aerolata]|uniref:ATP-binding cassette domain-containing protein n=1 Tax=Nakamurella aerolata TaxID=1656892 RepID=A0A849A5C0_9ACTN|nr:oligopeptide/dipeptide ABC transporter ATP-binding protein [Nakamurella aerolata]NNG35759.1 ATP-binding cassette domain-containing protein [Nakamurella aerolata]